MVLKYPFQDRIGGEIMIELAYSFHIGNDKNKTKKANQKNTPTNYNNNAIQSYTKCYAVIKSKSS